ncbi:hypothetical protein B0H10DRAFT_1937663 [Mycena sp. CBHHK59/15]|nr:hypothetical protein B0H10DRAFT_1937663 [Mycena sp. CBHHK59/15]
MPTRHFPLFTPDFCSTLIHLLSGSPVHPTRTRYCDTAPAAIEEDKDEANEIEEPDDKPAASGEEKDTLFIEWTDELTWTLVSGIESDLEMQDGLFPGVGGIARTAGKAKTHYYYELSKHCFANHPQYKDVFAIDPTQNKKLLAKERKLWTNKIKNRVGTLVTKTKKDITEMGQTGAGIASEDEIRSGTSFTSKWGESECLRRAVCWNSQDLIKQE